MLLCREFGVVVNYELLANFFARMMFTCCCVVSFQTSTLIPFLAQGSRGNVQAAQGSAEQKHPKRYRSSFNSTVAYDSKYDLNDLSSRWRSL